MLGIWMPMGLHAIFYEMNLANSLAFDFKLNATLHTVSLVKTNTTRTLRVESWLRQPCSTVKCVMWAHMNPRWSKLIRSPPLQCPSQSICHFGMLNPAIHKYRLKIIRMAVKKCYFLYFITLNSFAPAAWMHLSCSLDIQHVCGGSGSMATAVVFPAFWVNDWILFSLCHNKLFFEIPSRAILKTANQNLNSVCG